MRRSLGAGFTRRCVLIVPRSRERQINYHDTMVLYPLRSKAPMGADRVEGSCFYIRRRYKEERSGRMGNLGQNDDTNSHQGQLGISAFPPFMNGVEIFGHLE